MKTETTNKTFHPLKVFKKVKSLSEFDEDSEECSVIENPDKKLAAKIKSTKLPKGDLFLEDGIAERVSDLGTEYLYKLGNGKHLVIEHSDFADLRRKSNVRYINHIFQVEHHFNEHFGLLFGNSSIRLIPRKNEFVSIFGYDNPTAQIHDFKMSSNKTCFSLVGEYCWSDDSITLWFDEDGNYVTTEYPYDLFLKEKKPITMEKIIAEVKKLIPEGTYMHDGELTWFADEFAVRLEFEEPDEEDDEDDDDDDDDNYNDGEGDRLGFSLEIIKRNKNGTYGSRPAIERPEKLTPVKRQSIILAATQAASRFGF